MAGTHQNLGRRVVKIFINGKRADNQYALADAVGATVRRVDQAARRAAVSTSRKASPLAKVLITAAYSIKPSKLTDKVKTRMDGQTLHVDASTRRFALIDFAGKWAGRRSIGATASILVGQMKTYAGAFIATIQGLRSIRVRKAKGGKRVARGPVQIVRGRSTFQMITGRDADGNIVDNHGIADKLKAQLIAFYVTEVRRLYKVAGRS